MVTKRISLLSFALVVSSFAAGCDGGTIDECNAGNPCWAVHECWAPSPEPILLCDGSDIASGSSAFRQTCQWTNDPETANTFCKDECVKAATQNGHSEEDAEVLCEYAQAVPVLDEYAAYQGCAYEKAEYNMPGDYSPEAKCPKDEPHVFCHANGEPTNPPGVEDHDFDELLFSWWQETQEGSQVQYTPDSLPPATGCGYKVYKDWYPGLDDDQICVQYCLDVIDGEDGSPGDSVQINHHNCAGVTAGSLCNGPAVPALVGPVTVPLSLWASLGNAAGPITSTTFSGLASYSTYTCPAGATSCPIIIHDLSLTMDQPVSGVWTSAAGSTWFSSDDLALSLNRSTSGTYLSGDGAFALEALTLPVHVAGEIALGSTGAPMPVDLDTHNTGAISGAIQSDGSLTVSGSFELSPGMIVTFEPPAPQ